MRHTFKLAITSVTAVFAVLVAPLPSSAATGPDSSFGNNGTALGNLPGNDRATAVAVQSSGKIVFTVANAQNKWQVGRLNTNGSLDTSFGVGGYWTGYDGQARDLAVDKDDNILVVGRDGRPNGSNYGTLFWVGPNGGVASGFPPDGTPCGCMYSQVQVTNSKIYVSGYDSNETDTYANMNRYQINGSLDYSYGFDGISFVPVPGTTTPGATPSLAMNTNGLPVALLSTSSETRLVRKLNNGALDASYGGPVAGAPTGSVGLSTLPNGKAVAGLSWPDHANFTFFDTAGQAASSIALPAGATPVDTAVTKAGAVALVYKTANSWGVIKTNADGAINTNFGTAGWLTQTTNLTPAAISADKDGRIIVTGATTNNADWAVARVDIDGTAPPAMDWFTHLLFAFWRWLLSIFGITS